MSRDDFPIEISAIEVINVFHGSSSVLGMATCSTAHTPHLEGVSAWDEEPDLSFNILDNKQCSSCNLPSMTEESHSQLQPHARVSLIVGELDEVDQLLNWVQGQLPFLLRLSFHYLSQQYS